MKYFVLAMFLAVSHAAVYLGSSPPESFAKMSSPDGNDWGARNQAGAILGFAVFGCAYVATVIAIMLDIKKNGLSLDQSIADDLSEMKGMGLDSKMAEFKAELEIRLSGVKVFDTGDDQLLGEAQKLTQDQFKKYM